MDKIFLLEKIGKRIKIGFNQNDKDWWFTGEIVEVGETSIKFYEIISRKYLFLDSSKIFKVEDYR